MGLCDAHQGMADNIEHLRTGQDELFKLTSKTALDVNSMSAHVTQLFELTTQGDDRFKEFKIEFSERLDELLTEVRKMKRKPSLAKIIAIVIPSLLGSGGVAAMVSAIRAKMIK